MHPQRRTRLIIVVLAILALPAACSSAATPSAAAIQVTDAWARSSSAMASAAAAYATITNRGGAADALIGASSPAAATVEVHETVVIGSPAPSSGVVMGAPAASSGGMMGMRPVARVEIPAGGSLQLKPGSYHVMLIGLVKDLAIGDTIDLTLRFEKAGSITVKALVRAS